MRGCDASGRVHLLSSPSAGDVCMLKLRPAWLLGTRPEYPCMYGLCTCAFQENEMISVLHRRRYRCQKGVTGSSVNGTCCSLALQVRCQWAKRCHSNNMACPSRLKRIATAKPTCHQQPPLSVPVCCQDIYTSAIYTYAVVGATALCDAKFCP